MGRRNCKWALGSSRRRVPSRPCTNRLCGGKEPLIAKSSMGIHWWALTSAIDVTFRSLLYYGILQSSPDEAPQDTEYGVRSI